LFAGAPSAPLLHENIVVQASQQDRLNRQLAGRLNTSKHVLRS
jgi:hypothetical protein